MKKRKIGVLFFIFLFLLAGLMIDLPVDSRNVQAAESNPMMGSFAPLAKQASQSVVSVSTVRVVENRGLSPFDFGSPFQSEDPFEEFFKRFFRDQIPKKFEQRGLGSGFIIDNEGFILTNNHVVEKAEKIEVTLSDDKEFKAKLVGRDPKTDLALLKIDTDHSLRPLTLGDSEKLEVGDWVVAIGNPFGLGHTVTAGIVSAKYRRIGTGAYDDFIQTDASINPGNSGGPLLNMRGEVVGITTAIFSQSGGSIGIGFAIPINMVRELLPQLKKGKVIRGWLGVVIQEITPELKEKLDLKTDKGALVSNVTPDSPADKAGIKRGDVIVSYDGKEINELRDLSQLVAITPVGEKVSVEVLRKGEKRSFTVEIEELKEEGEVTPFMEEKPNLGMTLQEITPEMAKRYGLSESHGVVVSRVERGSSAAEAGVRAGDIILEVDQEPVMSLDEFNRKIREYGKGDTILLLINRGGMTQYLTIKVRE